MLLGDAVDVEVEGVLIVLVEVLPCAVVVEVVLDAVVPSPGAAVGVVVVPVVI